jgi:hypothetical protein
MSVKCEKHIFEGEKDIEELRRVALALNDSVAQLLTQLRKRCSDLEKLKGSKDALQQTLALIDTLTATTDEPPAAPSSPDGPAPAPRPPKPPARTGPTPQPHLLSFSCIARWMKLTKLVHRVVVACVR